jgi:hypothetical protein
VDLTHSTEEKRIPFKENRPKITLTTSQKYCGRKAVRGKGD